MEGFQSAILEAIDGKFKTMDGKFDVLHSEIMRVEKTVSTRLDEFEKKLDSITSTLDHFLKRIDDQDQEFTILKAEVALIKKILKDKLDIEVALQS